MRTKTLHIMIVVLFSALAGKINAQQLPQLSMYLDNAFVLNPAVAGSNDYFDVKGMNRSQWAGITDAPRTFTLSLQGPLKNPHIGLGGHLFTDNVGPTRRTGIQLTYAWHFFLNEDMRLGLGLSAGAIQFAIDGSKITLAEEGDPALFGELRSETVVDATFGAMLYTDKYFIGFSLPQLLQNQMNLYDSQQQASNRLEDHYFVMGGYRYTFSDDWMVEPSFLVKYVNPTPLKWEISTRAWYQNMVFAGLSYRSNDALVAMAGYQYMESVSIAYAYDMTTSGLREHTTGTHEILIGFRFNQR
ncbi:PorP/SprF family type IX secretion system membrane protein [Sanyastnella coralliicola]|uniref:PorP/SprF family type IX secretion system membrane protein n=1 Tax=Sanyastnella coralliicola TaxID=3069118 RepID=UPI0027B8BE28|nr:type IX secretion system membrane protein PorP/SprF [Longitalea sp. SCSIO 12813]